MIFVQSGSKYIRTRNMRIDSQRTMSDKHFAHLMKNSESRKKRVEELRKYYEEHKKELAGSEI